MSKLINENLDIFLSPSKILENSEYLNWLFKFSLKHKNFSDDPTYLNEDILESDIINLKRLSSLVSALEYICISQNVKKYTYFLRETNTNIISIYFIYRDRRFVISKQSNSISICKVAVRSNTDKNKHKYVNLDKILK